MPINTSFINKRQSDMKPSVYIPTLQELALVKISIILWNQKSLGEFTKRDQNGHVHLEKALMIVKKSSNSLGLPIKIEKLLTDVLERVGYKICSFMTQTILNSCDLQCFKGANYTSGDLSLSKDVQWTCGGEISVENTCTSFMRNHPQASPLLIYLSACETANEFLISQVWNNLTKEQQSVIENNLSWTENDVFLAYWVCLHQNQLNTYFNIYRDKNFIISSRGSIYCYLTLRSMESCFRSRTNYFYSKLEKTEKDKFVEIVDINGKRLIYLGRVKYLFKFFEAPIVNQAINTLILDSLPVDEFEYLIDYLLSKINNFGELHSSVLLSLMSKAPEDVKSWTLQDPDFYFTLISKGRIDIVKMLIDDEIKNILKEELTLALKTSEVPPSLKLVLVCEYSQQLQQLVDVIANNTENNSTLKTLIKSLRFKLRDQDNTSSTNNSHSQQAEHFF